MIGKENKNTFYRNSSYNYAKNIDFISDKHDMCDLNYFSDNIIFRFTIMIR